MEEKITNDAKNKSIGKTLAILSTFTECEPMQKTSDIANKLNLNISTVSRHLNTLLDAGYLQRDDATGYYSPGFQIISLAGTAIHNKPEYRYTMPLLQAISTKHSVHGHMGVADGNDIVHLISTCCEQTKELIIPMGHRQPLFCSAMGRVVMSDLPSDRIDEILKTSDVHDYTLMTILDTTEIKKEIENVKKIGYCIVKGELVTGKASIAVSIRDRADKIVGVISVSTSISDLSKAGREEELIKVLKHTARKISGQLGHYPK